MFSRSRYDEIEYATENHIPILQDDNQLNQDDQQNLDALCLPRILDAKMTGVITHVRCPPSYEKKKTFSTFFLYKKLIYTLF